MFYEQDIGAFYRENGHAREKLLCFGEKMIRCVLFWCGIDFSLRQCELHRHDW